MADTQQNKEVPIVTFVSYNSTGMNCVTAQWTNELCRDLEADYCAIQEHFKNTKMTHKFFKDKFSEYNSYVINAHRAPGVDTALCEKPLKKWH